MRTRQLLLLIWIVGFSSLSSSPGQTPSPTVTVTPSPSATGSPTPTPSIPPTPSPTPTASATATPSATPTPSVTPGPSITPTPGSTATPSATGEALANISTRARAQTGENVLIGGFILANGSSTKEIAIRALGPSLGARGVAFPLLDPSLQLFDGSGQLIASNDDWMSNANEQDIVDSTLAPTDPRESAILTFLGPGNYTAVVTGIDGTTSNIALVEVYDLGSTTLPNLANISTRASVDTGDGQMIAGVIVGGTTVKAIAFRGLGPSLSSAGIANPLPNPTLTVVDGFGVVVGTNDDWQNGTTAGDVQAVGLAPLDSLESALVLSLPPGNYTAILSDASGASGVGLVEVYNVTSP